MTEPVLRGVDLNRYLEKVAQSIWAQSLDNTSEDPHYTNHKGSSFRPAEGSIKFRGKFGKSKIKDGVSFKSDGDHLLFETSGTAIKDKVGRKAPVASYTKYSRKFKSADEFANHHVEGLRKFNEATLDGKRIHEKEFSTVHANLKSFYNRRRLIHNSKRLAAGVAAVGALGLANQFIKSRQ